jgi:hypothetical protein
LRFLPNKIKPTQVEKLAYLDTRWTPSKSANFFDKFWRGRLVKIEVVFHGFV